MASMTPTPAEFSAATRAPAVRMSPQSALAAQPGRHSRGAPLPADGSAMDTSLWMSRDLVTAGPATLVPVAAARMAQRRIRHLLVVDPADSRNLIGIVSSHDLYAAAAGGERPSSIHALERAAIGDALPLRAILTPNPLTIPSSTPIAAAARILRDRKFGCLPVVDHGELVGVLTEHDLLRAFLAMTGAEQDSTEICCAVTPRPDVLGELFALAQQHGIALDHAAAFAHGGQRLAVFSTRSDEAAFVEALWGHGHKVLRVHHPAPQQAPTTTR